VGQGEWLGILSKGCKLLAIGLGIILSMFLQTCLPEAAIGVAGLEALRGFKNVPCTKKTENTTFLALILEQGALDN
jgi:hypothetical protein